MLNAMKSCQGRKIFLQISFFLLAVTQYCNAQWFWQNPLPTGTNLNSVKFIDAANGWAVGILVPFSEQRTVVLTGLHNQAEQQTCCLMFLLQMKITGRLLAGWYNSQNNERWCLLDFTIKRNNRIFDMVFLLQMKITEQLLAGMVQFSEQRTAVLTGLHNQAEQQTGYMSVSFTDENNGTAVGE